LSILESLRHELRIAHGLTLMTPSLRGWEAFPTPGALTHTSITWAFSPPAPQVPGVTPGSPLCPWCFGHPYGEVRDTKSTLSALRSHTSVVRCGGGGGETGLRELGAGDGARMRGGSGLPGEDGGSSGMMGSLEVLESATNGRTL
jgi:hypothetical protein